MINRILVPIDGSDHAFNALDLASEIAVTHDARVFLLHALSDRVPSQDDKGLRESRAYEGAVKRNSVHGRRTATDGQRL